MNRFEDNVQAKVRVHEAMDWFEFFDSRLYEIDCRLWTHQKDIATLRGVVHKMRGALPANVGAYLRQDDEQARHVHTSNTLDHGRSHAQRLDFVQSSESNGVVSELTETSTSKMDKTTAHVTEHQRSTASDTSASTDAEAYGVAGCVAHIQQLQSAVLMSPFERAKGSSEKQRVGLRRSPRRHRQT